MREYTRSMNLFFFFLENKFQEKSWKENLYLKGFKIISTNYKV